MSLSIHISYYIRLLLCNVFHIYPQFYVFFPLVSLFIMQCVVKSLYTAILLLLLLLLGYYYYYYYYYYYIVILLYFRFFLL